MGHVPRVHVRVGLGSGLASGKGWVGTCPVNRLDPLLYPQTVQIIVGQPPVVGKQLKSLVPHYLMRSS